MKVRSYLATLVVAVLVPVVLFSAVAVQSMVASEREAVRQSMQELARATVLAVDHELVYAEATVKALGTSVQLQNEDFARFYVQMKAASAERAVHGALIDEQGNQLFNTIRPFGTAVMPPNADTLARTNAVFRSSQVQVSNLVRGRATGQYLVTVELPVITGSGKRYLVDQWMFASHLQTLLPHKDVPATWLIAVFDRQGMTIARNRSHNDYVGTRPRDELLAAMRKDPQSGVVTVSREGKEVYTALARSQLSGWVAAVGVPMKEIERTAVRAVTLTAAGLLLAVACAVAGALFLGQRLVRGIEALDRSARTLGEGQVPPASELHVHEMNQLQQSLTRAGLHLQQVDAERAAHLVRAQEAQHLAESQSRAKDEFLAMLGHELRNPLAAITSAVALLKLLPDGAPGAVRARDVIGRQSQQLNSLVDELLDAQRILTGKIKLKCVPVDAEAALLESADAHQAQLAAAGHTLAIDSRPAWVLADPIRLQQIIANLLDNAIKYTPPGGRITLGLQADAGQVSLRVGDSGLGMSDELRARIFELFVQGDMVNRQKGGLGIGLAVVRALAEQQGGSVHAASAGPGQGSCFTVLLPQAEAPAEPVTAAEEARPAPAAVRSVLLVEDNDDVRNMLVSLLEASGIAVRAAANGIAGIAAADDSSIVLGLIDIDLPDMSGHDVARAIRARRALPLIALTGYGQASDRQRASESGFDLHLTKPVRIDDLVAAIESVLASSASQSTPRST